ncbi:hypothetical protein PIB30_019005 [Stylosanthes scabra]|uniref:Uncharacterized protein n=1 Tax=Stylosanthes scabra TaxID=79078 RepID=A0ABU6R8A9_9FABA|nr:hypothetical protein [Stylosanthes scabra]
MGRAGNTCVCPSLRPASPEMMGGGNPLERSGDTSHTEVNALSFCDCGQGWRRCKSRDHSEYLSPMDEVEDWSNNGEREVLSDDEEDWRVNFAQRRTGTLLEVKVWTIKMMLCVMFGTMLSIVLCGLAMWLGKK